MSVAGKPNAPEPRAALRVRAVSQAWPAEKARVSRPAA